MENGEDKAESERIWKNNRNAIEAANREVLSQTTLIIGGLTILICIADCIIGQLQQALIHFALVILSLIIHLYCRYTSATERNSVIGIMYGYVGVIFGLSTIQAYFITPSAGVTMFAVATMAVALTILDSPRRVLALYGAATAVFCLSAITRQTPARAVFDVIYSVTFSLIGLFIGDYVRKIKIEGIETRRMLAIQSNTDSLTGLANRRSLFEYLSVLEGPLSEEALSGVCMVDVDFFKEYNDHYGHQAGDDCLHTLGEVMTAFGEENSIRFFRYGGEEFLGTSTRHNREGLERVAEELRKRIDALGIPYECYERGHITVSIGYAPVTDGRKAGYEKCISHADVALYAAKAEGRNKVAGYSADMQQPDNVPHCTTRTRR